MPTTPLHPPSTSAPKPHASRYHYLTFPRLARLSSSELESLLLRSITPDPARLLGWEFRGFSHNPITLLARARRFRKAFLPDPAYPSEPSFLLGYNVAVHPGLITDPYTAAPSEGHPFHHSFYHVRPCPIAPLDHLYPHALFLNYFTPPQNPSLQPTRLLRSYLAQPDPQNPDLLLGKAYLALHDLRLPAGFFVLERYNPIGL